MVGPRRPLDAHRAIVRAAVSAAFGVAAEVAAAARLPLLPAGLVGWVVAGLVEVGLTWAVILGTGAGETRARAGADDPGRTVVYAVALITSCASLMAAALLVHSARDLPPDVRRCMPILCLVTVAIAWTLTHTAFTFRYAHLYYREGAQGEGGIAFPGGAPPAYGDFAYFAFTIGMCFQASDASVTSPQIRRLVLMHALIGFAYNTVILAFVLGIVFGAA